MFFIEFTYDFCKRIVLEFFCGFSNDLFHEINMVGGQLLAGSTGDKTTDKVELGGQCILDTLWVVDNMAIS